MGPLRGIRWVDENASEKTRVGFMASVYAVSFYFVWMILSFFVMRETTFTDRALVGLIPVAIILFGYPFKKGMPNPLAFISGMPIWGRNLMLIGVRFFPAMVHDDTRKVLVDSSKTIIMLMFIVVNALLFAHVLTSERIPQIITDWMVGVGFNWFTFLIAVNLLLLLGGQFMEPSGLLLIVAPVMFPIAMELGIDPIHLGIIMVVNMEIGMITPPIGLNLFVTSGITGMSLM
ncbi:MAG: TRAP transporter large permease subunit, partial [Rhodospirillaceae bacterium]|nr:TRAP transporter large permease subunit [Rhodospirillaceae bacterium]